MGVSTKNPKNSLLKDSSSPPLVQQDTSGFYENVRKLSGMKSFHAKTNSLNLSTASTKFLFDKVSKDKKKSLVAQRTDLGHCKENIYNEETYIGKKKDPKGVKRGVACGGKTGYKDLPGAKCKRNILGGLGSGNNDNKGLA